MVVVVDIVTPPLTQRASRLLCLLLWGQAGRVESQTPLVAMENLAPLATISTRTEETAGRPVLRAGAWLVLRPQHMEICFKVAQVVRAASPVEQRPPTTTMARLGAGEEPAQAAERVAMALLAHGAQETQQAVAQQAAQARLAACPDHQRETATFTLAPHTVAAAVVAQT